jgi:hypothetical protein
MLIHQVISPLRKARSPLIWADNAGDPLMPAIVKSGWQSGGRCAATAGRPHNSASLAMQGACDRGGYVKDVAHVSVGQPVCRSNGLSFCPCQKVADQVAMLKPSAKQLLLLQGCLQRPILCVLTRKCSLFVLTGPCPSRPEGEFPNVED